MKSDELNLKEITGTDDPDLAVFAHASEAELYRYYEPEDGIFIAETANVILRALEAGYEILSMLVEDKRLHIEAAPVFDKVEELYGIEKVKLIPVYVAGHDVVTKLTGYNLVRGLWATFRRKPLPSLEDFCAGKNKIAVLYDVVNPTNVGAIIRSAAALSVDGVLLTDHSVNPLTRRSSRVSMGTVFQIPWTVVSKNGAEEENIVERLQKLNYKTIAMALTENSVRPDDENLKREERKAIVLGTEGDGLPDGVIEKCDYRVMIPMGHGVDSLNVAAASAVIFWEFTKP